MINHIYNGDCLEVMPCIESKSIDMILCDLPYGTTACKWDTIIPFEPLWVQYKRLIKDNGAIVLTASQPFTSALVMSNPGWFKYCWVWDKVNRPTGHLNAKKQPLRQTEDIVIFAPGSGTYNPQMTKGTPYSATGSRKSDCYGSQKTTLTVCDGRRHPRNLLSISADERGTVGRIHPTQKPVALFEYLIRTYTNEGDTVLDNCAGSGTTGIACLNTKRQFILIERDENYCDIIKTRIRNHQPLFTQGD
jgi:site-specific DNA-methyltransferase (adenine-specific)